ncbi:MAG: hypothetical protein AB7O38_23690, partial [Pirellulaceae bacterium]
MSTEVVLLLAASWSDKLAAMSWLELALWVGLAALTLALLILMGTRWGHVRPVSKCVVLSVFAHLLFLCYAYGTRLNVSGGHLAGDLSVRVSFLNQDEVEHAELAVPLADSMPPSPSEHFPLMDDAASEFAPPADADLSPSLDSQAAAKLPPELDTTQPAQLLSPSPEPPPDLLAPPEPMPEAAEPATDEPETEVSEPPARVAIDVPQLPPADIDIELPEVPKVVVAREPSEPTGPPAEPPTAQPDDPPPAVAAAPPASPPPAADQPAVDVARQPERDAMPPEETPLPVMPVASAPADAAPVAAAPPSADSGPDAARTAEAARQVIPEIPPVQTLNGRPVPDVYRMRQDPHRMPFAFQLGSNEETEAAVQAALLWLAAQQQADGRWDASEFGAGRETRTLGQDRRGAGADADTGITGLALLAHLGAGHTHLSGRLRETVQHGLEFLLASQHVDGNLAGAAKQFERMYCHGIAFVALAEAYAMTGDARLLPGLRRALQYTLAAQDRVSGGWRYQPGDRGDMSQFGWQVMALRSAELGGLTTPATNRQLMLQFLDSSAQGAHRGLASYRPGERTTRTMTAEAMTCRVFLAVPISEETWNEAIEFLLQELPGQQEPNLY